MKGSEMHTEEPNNRRWKAPLESWNRLLAEELTSRYSLPGPLIVEHGTANIKAASSPTFAGKFQARICSLLNWDLQRRRKLAHSQPATPLQIVHPTSPVKAWLWLLGRPWDGSCELDWPNGFAIRLPASSSAEPSANVPGAKTLARWSSWARRQWWFVRVQLSMLARETLWRLAGRRGKGPGGPTSPHCTLAARSGDWAFSSHAPEEIEGTNLARLVRETGNSCGSLNRQGKIAIRKKGGSHEGAYSRGPR